MLNADYRELDRMTRDELSQATRVLAVAAEALHLMAQGLRRQGPLRLTEDDEYAPDAVRYWLSAAGWANLASAAEGGSHRTDGSVRVTGDRASIVALKADLEMATDAALAELLHWRSVARVYKIQQRWAVYLAKRATFELAPGLMLEPSGPVAFEEIAERISRTLGWRASSQAA